MTATNRIRRGRGTTRTTNKDSYGGDIATLDRMNEVWALRLRGYSFRAIGEKLGINHNTAWRDCREVQDNLTLMDDQSIARAQLLQGHRLLMDALMHEIEQQRQNGCITEEVLPNGDVKRKITRPDGRLIGEAGRCLDRAARLLGLLDGPLEGEPGGNGTQNTSIVLVNPGSAAEFGQRAAELAQLRQTEPAPIDVSVAQEPPEPASTAPEASAQPLLPRSARQSSAQPEAATAPLEPPEAVLSQEQPPLTGWRASRARRKALEAAQSQEQGNGVAGQAEAPSKGRQRPAVRFLAPQRN